MSALEGVLGSIDGGKVLDIATQQGGFVQILTHYLKSFTEIVGIDIDQTAIETAQSTVTQPRVRFQVMNAEQLDFADCSFDTLTLSASLHHLSNIPCVLDEGKRVLKPGGHLVLAEMHRDGETEAELTSVYLHHWVARVDSALGRVHDSTLARQAFVDHIARLELQKMTCYDEPLLFTDEDWIPHGAGFLTGLTALRNRKRFET